MITNDQLTAAGKFLKAHGIKGELNASLTVEPDYFDSYDCIVCMVDGIAVPFFIESVRSKGSASVLMKLDGICSETAAMQFVGETFYVIKKDYLAFQELSADDDASQGYADDFIGYNVVDTDAGELGIIIDLETSTDNALFIIQHPESGKTVYMPVVEDFIISIDDDRRVITTSLPEGLADLNN